MLCLRVTSFVHAHASPTIRRMCSQKRRTGAAKKALVSIAFEPFLPHNYQMQKPLKFFFLPLLALGS